MKISKLLLLGVLASSLCMGSSALGQCTAVLADGLGPTGGLYSLGDTIPYTMFVTVPDVAGYCTLTNMTVYFFPQARWAPEKPLVTISALEP